MQTNASISQIDVAQKTIQLVAPGASRTTRTSVHELVEYQNLVLANPLGSVLLVNSGVQRPMKPKLQAINNNTKEGEFRYTQFFVCCIQLSKLPVKQAWSAAFEPANPAQPLQLLSYTNLDTMAGMKDCILGYVTAHGNHTSNVLSAQEQADIVAQVGQILLFQREQCVATSILHYEAFETTMPVLNKALFEQLQKIQGKESIWNATAALNAYPSLESACFRGRLAARQILNSDAVYLQKVRQWNRQEVSKFQGKIISGYKHVLTLGLWK
jgi:hypothetical protein